MNENTEEIPRFSEFAEEDAALTGDKIKIEKVIGREIIVTAFHITQSKYGKHDSEMCMKLQFKIDGKAFVLFTGSNVLIEQIKKYQSHIPFRTTIQCVDKYYTFS